MSMQFQAKSTQCNKSSDALNVNPALKRHFSGKPGFNTETQINQIQTKLKIGQAGDRYEQEADQIADTIMTMPDPALQLKPG